MSQFGSGSKALTGRLLILLLKSGMHSTVGIQLLQTTLAASLGRMGPVKDAGRLKLYCPDAAHYGNAGSPLGNW